MIERSIEPDFNSGAGNHLNELLQNQLRNVFKYSREYMRAEFFMPPDDELPDAVGARFWKAPYTVIERHQLSGQKEIGYEITDVITHRDNQQTVFHDQYALIDGSFKRFCVDENRNKTFEFVPDEELHILIARFTKPLQPRSLHKELFRKCTKKVHRATKAVGVLIVEGLIQPDNEQEDHRFRFGGAKY